MFDKLSISDVTIGILFGIIFGFILFYMIAKKHGPNSNEFRQRVFKKDGKCFKFVPKIHICPIK
jgi:hypothetical protein